MQQQSSRTPMAPEDGTKNRPRRGVDAKLAEVRTAMDAVCERPSDAARWCSLTSTVIGAVRARRAASSSSSLAALNSNSDSLAKSLVANASTASDFIDTVLQDVRSRCPTLQQEPFVVSPFALTFVQAQMLQANGDREAAAHLLENAVLGTLTAVTPGSAQFKRFFAGVPAPQSGNEGSLLRSPTLADALKQLLSIRGRGAPAIVDENKALLGTTEEGRVLVAELEAYAAECVKVEEAAAERASRDAASRPTAAVAGGGGFTALSTTAKPAASPSKPQQERSESTQVATSRPSTAAPNGFVARLAASLGVTPATFQGIAVASLVAIVLTILAVIRSRGASTVVRSAGGAAARRNRLTL